MSIHFPNPDDLLTPDVVRRDGILWSDDIFFFDTYKEGNFQHYERLFIRDEKGSEEPFTGLVYDPFPDGSMQGYSQYVSGYTEGEDVTFYKNGRLARYDYVTKEVYGSYIIIWTEQGAVQETYENYRKDNPRYRRIKKYDENGRLIHQEINCEIEFTYEFDSPDTSYEVTWHENGEFKLIRKKEPDRNTFYSEMEFDENGYPVRISVNPHYSPEYFSYERVCQFFTVDIYGEGNHLDGDIMMKESEDGYYKYTGYLCYRNKDGQIESIRHYIDGIPCAGQSYYYPNGDPKEEYAIEKGKEYYRHLYWYEGGRLKKAVLYSNDRKNKHIICFDEDGNVTSEGEYEV